MVENQHSINTVLSFSAKSVNPEILEKLLIGREKTADYLLDSVKAIAEHGNNQQILVIGQRGMGKTHLLRVLFHKIQDYINEKKIVVAYFAEEEYGVANYFDFLMRIVNALLKWKTEKSVFLEEKIQGLQTFPVKYIDKIRENYIEKVIEDYLDSRPLLILAENFSDILKSINVKEQAKLRSWLYTLNRISIIASSQALSRDFDSEDRPFYGFFNIYYLKNLSYEDSVKFLVALAEVDNRPDIVQFLQSKGQNQVRALHQLVKGNHRLLVTFYSFLKTDTLVNLSVNFIKTINDLKPYYETFIRFISPQQQKILRYIALSRKPKQGTEISKNCFIEQKSTSKELSELVRKGLLEAITDPNDKRNKLYDINEPLLRISIEVGEHKEGITALFIDFLAVYYNEAELIKRKDRFNELSKQANSSNEKLMFSYELTAINRALELKKTEFEYLKKDEVFEIIRSYIGRKDYKGFYEFWEKTIVEIDKKYLTDLIFSTVNILMTSSLQFWRNGKRVLYFLRENIKLVPDDYEVNALLGGMNFSVGILENSDFLIFESIEQFKKTIEIKPDFSSSYFDLGISLSIIAINKKDDKLYLESIKSFNKALELGFLSEVKESDFCGFIFNSYKRIYEKLNKKIDSKFLIKFFQIFQIDEIKSILNEWIMFILKVSNSLDSDQLDNLESIAKRNTPEIPELAITENYIKIYKRYVLENDKKAIYDLPKEQRIFFEEEILGLK